MDGLQVWQRCMGSCYCQRLEKGAGSTCCSESFRSLLETGKFELMGNEVMEDKILSSRLALRLLDFASWELNDLRLRIQSLEGISELRRTMCSGRKCWLKSW